MFEPCSYTKQVAAVLSLMLGAIYTPPTLEMRLLHGFLYEHLWTSAASMVR
jgi:hypothetical protein